MARTVKEQLGVDLEEKEIPAVVEEPKVEDERPEWLPENFKSAEDFAASYKEAQRRITEESQRSAGLEAKLSELTEVVQSLNKPQQQSNEVSQDKLMEAFENDPIGTVAWLAQQYAGQAVEQRFTQFQQQQSPQLQAQNELLAISVDQQLAQKHSDWADYKTKVAEAIQNDETLLSETALQSPERTARALENVYKMVKADEVLAQVEAGTFGTDNTTRMKQQAQTITGAAGRPGTPDPQDEKIARLISAAKSSSYASMRSGQ